VCAVRSGSRRRAVAGALLVLLTAACGSNPPPDPEPTAAGPLPEPGARTQLAGLAAAAQDRHLAATYRLSVPDRDDRLVSVVLADDGSWRVDIPGGALGGTADVAVARNEIGLFQCALAVPSCARVGDPDDRLGAGIDPRIQRPFVYARSVLTDSAAPLAVSATATLPGVTGRCYAVETTTASVGSPLDVGIYCYADDGTLTGARLSYGTLVLAAEPAAAPPSIDMPGPVTPDAPLRMASPPPPPTPTPTAGTATP
jgi:hypothetical protein